MKKTSLCPVTSQGIVRVVVSVALVVVVDDDDAATFSFFRIFL